MLWLTLKRLLFCLAWVLTSPLVLATWLESALLGRRHERIFSGCKELLALAPTTLGQYLRAAFYWSCCSKVSADICLLLGAMLAHRDTEVGRRVVIGSYTIVGFAVIGDDVLIGSRASIVSGKFQHGRPEQRSSAAPSPSFYETIRVGSNSWVGEGAIVLAHVGENCTIAAGAVLTREAPDGSTFVGNPARRVDQAARQGSDITGSRTSG